jgi:16S rRNA (cytosine967-C5)-methyltransferase
LGNSLSLAREVAYDTFSEVMERKAHPEDVLERYYAEHGERLKRLDRNFIKEIVYGTLRWYSKMYWILQKTSSRPLDTVHQSVRTALVCGTYQIFYMDRVPDRAAVTESVEYVRRKGQHGACPFVNGILRQIARRAEYFAKPDKQTQTADYLSLQFSHPKWMVERWLQDFKMEKLEVMLSANNKAPPCFVRINTTKIPQNESLTLQQDLLRDEKTHSDRRPLRCSLQLRDWPRLDAESLFGKGFYTIQDEAAQLVSYLVQPKEGETIVDTCCGPGGKLTHLFELTGGNATLIGIERDADQMQRAKETARRLGCEEKIQWVEADFNTWNPLAPPHKILLDAPCSAMGVLRRHPEGKWHKTSTLISDMAKIQRQMILRALDILPVGGELVFSVCSFEREETHDHLEAILSSRKDVEIISPATRVPDYYKRYVTRERMLLIYAGNQDDMDGFGAFILRKKEGGAG